MWHFWWAHKDSNLGPADCLSSGPCRGQSGYGIHQSGSRASSRILTDDELRAIWKAAGATPGPFGAFVQVLLLTAARRGEAAGMAHSEIAGQDWTLPEARNKVKVDLIRPLSPAAQELIAKLPRIDKAG